MKLFCINSVPYGSTAKIMLSVAENAGNKGWQTFTASGYSGHPIGSIGKEHIYIGGRISKSSHVVAGRVTGCEGCFSVFATKRLIKRIRSENPDVIHIHNLHCWYLNLPMFFDFLKKSAVPVVWTLHDCWAFTGHCTHFDRTGCEKWKTGCFSCSEYRSYPESLFDNSAVMYKKKKKWFTGVKNLTVVTPSSWLADKVKASFLSCYPVKVINNGISLSVFSPRKSDFKARHGIDGKFMVLGVAYILDERKGLDDFIFLSQRLDSSFVLVLVGQLKCPGVKLPDNIIHIERTQDPAELAEIYSAADVFVNPTREDNFPTVNIEALACGTPVVTYDTGGSAEIIDESCGVKVKKGDTSSLLDEIKRIKREAPYSQNDCTVRAGSFDENKKFDLYTELFSELTEKR